MAGKQLTARAVATAKPGRYRDNNGAGLYLQVDPSGAKRWTQRLTINGKRRDIGLGSVAFVSLAEARARAHANKRAALEGRDPLAEARANAGVPTFRDAFEQVARKKQAEFRNEKYAMQWRSAVERHALPAIGDMPVNKVGLRDVLRVLESIWKETPETAARLRGRIEAVLAWATVAGHREGDNPARWKGNLDAVLAKPSKLKKVTHSPALSLSDAPRWWAALSTRTGSSADALRFLALTAARSGEVRGATWAEIDLEARLWVIAGDRMKAGREHRVPLSDTAVALLRALPRIEGAEHLFPAPRGGALSDMALSSLMRKMNVADGYLDSRSGRPPVPHGLRSTFRDWAAERGYPRDQAEIALAHSVGSDVERAYRRSDMLDRRRSMMEAWASFLEGAAEGGNIVQIGGGA